MVVPVSVLNAVTFVFVLESLTYNVSDCSGLISTGKEGERAYADNHGRATGANVRAPGVKQKYILLNGVIRAVVVNDERCGAIVVVHFEPELQYGRREVDGWVE